MVVGKINYPGVDVARSLGFTISSANRLAATEESADLRKYLKMLQNQRFFGIISYIGFRELGYKGIEVEEELHMVAGGVSVALRRGESILRERPEMKEKILAKLVK